MASHMYFSWTTPLIVRAYRHGLKEEDVSSTSDWRCPLLPDTASLLALFDSLEGDLRSRLWLMMRWRMIKAAVLMFLYSAIQLVLPLLLRGAVVAVDDDDPDGWWYAVAIGGLVFTGSLCKEHQLWLNYQVGAELRALFAALVYRRAMSMRQYELQPSTTNLITVDAQKFNELLPMINWLWAAPLSITAAAVILVSIEGREPSRAVLTTHLRAQGVACNVSFA
eukprot:6181339-Pleurochrysis_carterae.AAC.1